MGVNIHTVGQTYKQTSDKCISKQDWIEGRTIYKRFTFKWQNLWCYRTPENNDMDHHLHVLMGVNMENILGTNSHVDTRNTGISLVRSSNKN